MNQLTSWVFNTFKIARASLLLLYPVTYLIVVAVFAACIGGESSDVNSAIFLIFPLGLPRLLLGEFKGGANLVFPLLASYALYVGIYVAGVKSRTRIWYVVFLGVLLLNVGGCLIGMKKS